MSDTIHAETIKRFFRTMIPGKVLVVGNDNSISNVLSEMGFYVTDEIGSGKFDYVFVSMNDIDERENLLRVASIGKLGVVVSVDGNGNKDDTEKSLADLMTNTFQNVLLWSIGEKIYSWGVMAK